MDILVRNLYWLGKKIGHPPIPNKIFEIETLIPSEENLKTDRENSKSWKTAL
jgi:hypothetical protein